MDLILSSDDSEPSILTSPRRIAVPHVKNKSTRACVRMCGGGTRTQESTFDTWQTSKGWTARHRSPHGARADIAPYRLISPHLPSYRLISPIASYHLLPPLYPHQRQRLFYKFPYLYLFKSAGWPLPLKPHWRTRVQFHNAVSVAQYPSQAALAYERSIPSCAHNAHCLE